MDLRSFKHHHLGEIIVWILFPRIFFESQIQVYKASCIGGIHVRFLSGVSTLDIPSRELTYPTLGKRKIIIFKSAVLEWDMWSFPGRYPFYAKIQVLTPEKPNGRTYSSRYLGALRMGHRVPVPVMWATTRNPPCCGRLGVESSRGWLKVGRCTKQNAISLPIMCTQVGGEGATSCVFGTFFLDGVLKPIHTCVLLFSDWCIVGAWKFRNGFVDLEAIDDFSSLGVGQKGKFWEAKSTTDGRYLLTS